MNSLPEPILITGACGWLGSRLVETLVRGLAERKDLLQPATGARIRCLLLPGQDSGSLQKISNTIEVVTGDIRSAADCERFCQGSSGGLLFQDRKSVV